MYAAAYVSTHKQRGPPCTADPADRHHLLSAQVCVGRREERTVMSSASRLPRPRLAAALMVAALIVPCRWLQPLRLYILTNGR